MKKRILTKILIIIILSLSVGYTGCNFSMRNEPINKEGAVFTLEDIAVNGWGSGAANQDNNLTIEKMLKYALEDEYIKRTRYELICDKFDVKEPFYTMSKSETANIMKLITLFSKHNITIPADRSIEYIKTPKTLMEGYSLSIKGEENNAAMYEKFLKDNSIDVDMKEVFIKLISSSRENMKSLHEEMIKLNS